MPFVHEVAQHLLNDGVATANVNIFISTKANIPTGDGPFLWLLESGGMMPNYIQNQKPPAYQRPTVQLVGIGMIKPIADKIIWRAYNSLAKVSNQSLGTNSFSIVSLIRVGSVVTVTTSQPHRYFEDLAVTIAGALPTAYNGVQTITGIPSATTFTFTVAGSPTTPATGTMTVSFLGTFYLWTRPRQEPYDFGLDKSDRARMAFNVEAVKRPS